MKTRRPRKTKKPPACGSAVWRPSTASLASPACLTFPPRRSSCSGSGYLEGTLFPWTMSDFSLMDAIECGIVKLPRVPVAENIPGDEMPMFRELWEHIGKKMPKKGRGKGAVLDPLSIPVELQTALQALYGHYDKTYQPLEESRDQSPALFHRGL